MLHKYLIEKGLTWNLHFALFLLTNLRLKKFLNSLTVKSQLPIGREGSNMQVKDSTVGRVGLTMGLKRLLWMQSVVL